MPELFDVVNFQSESLVAPLLITEAEGEVDVLTLTTTPLPIGAYIFTISFVAQFNTAADALGFRLSGTDPSPDFLSVSDSGDDAVPFSYAYPLRVDIDASTLVYTLQAWISGVGSSDVTIGAANLMITRVGN